MAYTPCMTLMMSWLWRLYMLMILFYSQTAAKRSEEGLYLPQCSYLHLEPGTFYNAYLTANRVSCCMCQKAHKLTGDCNASSPDTTQCTPCEYTENRKTYISQEPHIQQRCTFDSGQCQLPKEPVGGSPSEKIQCRCPEGTIEKDRGCHPSPKPTPLQVKPTPATGMSTITPKTSQAPLVGRETEKVSSLAAPTTTSESKRVVNKQYTTVSSLTTPTTTSVSERPSDKQYIKDQTTSKPSTRKKKRKRTRRPDNKKEDYDESWRGSTDALITVTVLFGSFVLVTIVGVLVYCHCPILCCRNDHDEEQSSPTDSKSTNLADSFQAVSEQNPLLNNNSPNANTVPDETAEPRENRQDAVELVSLDRAEAPETAQPIYDEDNASSQTQNPGAQTENESVSIVPRSVSLEVAEAPETVNKAQPIYDEGNAPSQTQNHAPQQENGSVSVVPSDNVVRYSHIDGNTEQQQQHPNRTSRVEKQKVYEVLMKMSEVISKRDIYRLSRELLPREEHGIIEDMESQFPNNTPEMAARIFKRVTECVPNLTLAKLSQHVQNLGYLLDIVNDARRHLQQQPSN